MSDLAVKFYLVLKATRPHQSDKLYVKLTWLYKPWWREMFGVASDLCNTCDLYTAKPRFIVFVWGPKEQSGIGETDIWGGIYNIGFVRFEVFTAVTMKNCAFWVVTPCGSCKNRRFGGTWRLIHQGDKNRWTRNNTSCN
jgi:hypothetical protein